MKKVWAFIRAHARLGLYALAVTLILGFLLINRLGSLTGGLSASEVKTAISPVGWHGIYHAPFYLPLLLVRSVVYWLSPNHGQTLTRLPNVLFGGLAITIFGALIRLWHGKRNALFAVILFATSSWVLHISRIASFDVMYLLAVPSLLVVNQSLIRYGNNLYVWFAAIIIFGLLLFTPGLIWLILATIWFSRSQITMSWKYFNKAWQRGLTILFSLSTIVFLILDLTRPGQFLIWLGLPAHFLGAKMFIKHLIAVPVHLFVRGPQYPDVWLGRLPILDMFTLSACLIGIYFYAVHPKLTRTRLLGVLFILGWILIAMSGPVGLSLLVSLTYVLAATGITYLLHEWLHVFPLNPLARAFGITAIGLIVAAASVYNLRSYFVAWPHNSITRQTFRYHR